MSKFKVGDIVKATTDLYGMTCKHDNWEGRVIGVDGHYFHAETTKTDNPLLDIGYEFSSLNAEDFELVNPHCTKEIHITEDDNIVHAVMKEGEKVIKRSKAICSKDDEFDFHTGANLAFNRLFESSQTDEFTPYLQPTSARFYDKHYGNIGEQTPYRDLHGNTLKIGDVVAIFDSGYKYLGTQFVVNSYNYCDVKKPFIMAMESCCDAASGKIHTFKVIKLKDWKDVSHEERHGEIKACLHKD